MSVPTRIIDFKLKCILMVIYIIWTWETITAYRYLKSKIELFLSF